MAQRHPFPTICIALGFTQPEILLRHARQEIESGDRFLEIRLDYLSAPDQGLKVIRTLLKESPDCTILATCRRHQNGGRFNGGVEEQLRLLDAAVEEGARAVDVEIETAELAPVTIEGTAAGQVSARALRQLYRFEKISRNAKIYGVIADPVRHSISPAVH